MYLKLGRIAYYRELPEFFSGMGIIIKTVNSGGLVGFCI